MKIYYAHSRMKYASLVEAYELQIIKKRYPEAEIINPSTDLYHYGSEDEILARCIKVIQDCDMVVYSSVNNCVGRGVYTEVIEALKMGKTVNYINRNILVPHQFYRMFKLKEPQYNDMVYATVYNLGELYSMGECV